MDLVAAGDQCRLRCRGRQAGARGRSGAERHWYTAPTLQVLFWIVVMGMAINYALNSPSLKQLDIPTSLDAKYKSQAWIEMFGARGAKAGGSGTHTNSTLLLRASYCANAVYPSYYGDPISGGRHVCSSSGHARAASAA